MIRRIRVRLHEDEHAQLARLSAESGRTYNDVMREALRRLAEDSE
ncbi:ribbon-helix-helix protein, CopG family [Streptomyces chartreusis]